MRELHKEIVNDEFKNKIWNMKYGHNNPKLSPHNVFAYIAKEMAEVYPEDKLIEVRNFIEEKPLSQHTYDYFEESFYDLMNGAYFLPGGRVIAAMALKMLDGRKNLTLQNCYVIPIEADSLEAILECAKLMAMTYAWGGGVGTVLSGLRPSGTPVSNASITSTGPVSFMEIYDVVTKRVGQQGRRGALILSLSVHHPDILQFNRAKKEAELSNMNISVIVTDTFMKALNNYEDYELWYPVPCSGDDWFEDFKTVPYPADCYNYEDYKYFYVESEQQYRRKVVYSTISAQEVWNELCKNAWEEGCPGIVFKEAMINDCPYEYTQYKYHGTNPCFTGDTKVAVADDRNAVSFEQLAKEGKDVYVFCFDDNDNIVIRKMRNPRKTGENQKVYRVHFTNGNYEQATENHKFILSNNEEREVKDLQFGDNLKTFDKKSKINVVGVEYIGKQDVYNGTVDEFHNYFVGNTVEKRLKEEDVKWEFISVRNCGEEPLPGFGACNLGALNLSMYADNYSMLKKHTYLATFFLDCVLEYTLKHKMMPLKKHLEIARDLRILGLGITGMADYLVKRKTTYGSQESIDFIDQVMRGKENYSIEISEKLGEVFGRYPAYTKEASHDPRRNSQLSTIAPTGTISLLLGSSTGLEPVFALSYTKRIMNKATGFYETEKIEHPLYSKLKDNPDYQDVWIEAGDIEVKQRLKIQQVCQKYTDGSISSTINLPNSATIKSIEDTYNLAWQLGLKGVTIFRDGCFREGILKKTEETPTIESSVETLELIDREKTEILSGQTIHIPFEPSWYLTMNRTENNTPVEVFINAGKSGSNVKAETEAYGRLISLYLQEGGSIEKIIKSLQGIKGRETIFKQGWVFQSHPDAISKAIEKLLANKEEESILDYCPQCEQKTFVATAGCGHCENKECLYTNCG